jgi:asparagine synthase (glutamine-hydrolysing)
MCGIAGWLSINPSADGHARLQKMADSIAHRGPDGEGFAQQGCASFAHRRLAIVDLAGGAQPMASHDQRLLITFNGEIYNYRELMSELEREGASFSTRSDTEVILNIYRHWGAEGFARMRGMYAFVLWDEQKKMALLARDPLGIKPLFYQYSSRELVFGSEAKAIVASHNGGAQLAESSLHLLMNFRYLPDQRTLFKDIVQLAPGQVLQWQEGRVSERYSIPAENSALVADGLQALRESVHAHQVADVEVGAYLSGGVDSATMVSLMAETNSDLQSFTLGVGDDPAESEHARRSAELFGVSNDLHEQQLDAGARLRDVIWHLEVPKVNALQVDALAAHARRSVKVAVSGLGGDEVFLGYNAHRILNVAQRLSGASGLLSPLGSMAAGIARATSSTPWSEFERAGLMGSALGDWSRVYGLLRNLWDAPDMRRWLYGPRMLDANLDNAFEYLHGAWPSGSDPVMAMRDFEWRNKMVNDMLWQEDRCSMAHGLEVRTPFVDVGVRSSFWSRSRAELMPGGKAKGLLRELISPVVPAEIMGRPKSGFQVAAGEFFHEQLDGLANDWLSEDRVKATGLFNYKTVAALRALPPVQRHRWHYFILYLMLGTQMWVNLYEEGRYGSLD